MRERNWIKFRPPDRRHEETRKKYELLAWERMKLKSSINPAFQKYLLPDPDDEDAVHLLDRAIGSLDKRRQEIVLLLYFDNYTYEEIGRRLKVTKARVGLDNRLILTAIKNYIHNIELKPILDAPVPKRKAHKNFVRKVKRDLYLAYLQSVRLKARKLRSLEKLTHSSK